MVRLTSVVDSGGQLMDAALADVVRASEASGGLLYVLPPGENALWLSMMTGGPREITAPWTRVALSDPMPVADAVRERRLVWVGGQEEMARSYPRAALVLPYDFALAAAPVTSGTTLLGGLVLVWPGTHPPQLDTGERDAIETGCGHLGDLLQCAIDHGEPLLTPDRPRILPPPPVRTVSLEEAPEMAAFIDRLPGGSCALGLNGRITFVDPAAADLVGAATADLLGALPWEALPWMNAPEAEHCYRAALVSRQPASFRSLRPPDTWLSFELYPDSTGISVRIKPTSVAYDDPAPQPAPATGPSRGIVLTHVMHLAVTLTEAVGVRDVVEQTADHFLPALGAQAMALMAADDGRMRVLGYRGYSPAVMDRFDGVPLSSDAPGARVMTTGVPSFFATFDDLHSAYTSAVHSGDKSAWAFLPLIASGRTIGTLLLAYDRSRPFPPSERAILTSLAGLVGQALDRARLYDTRDQLAHRLQSALLPRTLPDIPGMKFTARYLPAAPGTGVGGDFYDLIHLGPHAAAAAIGDVQGHNMDAAALMGQVRTAVHAHATVGASPDDVLAGTNRLLNDLDPGLFSSCLYAHLDLARHRTRLASAGHPPPLLRHADGRTEILHPPPGLLLGIEPGVRYPSLEFAFPPGSVLALYTDGLIEAPGVDPDDALAAFAELLALSETADLDAMAETLVRHALNPVDDIALLLISPQ